MKKIFTLLVLFPFFLQSQEFYQYFDGADTAQWNSIQIDFGTDTNNLWQIGRPQKIIFDTAATFPNALVTDTINYYPNNDTSSFQIHIDRYSSNWDFTSVFAIHWQQKLDFDTLFDGGMIEFSTDSGNTWENALNSPYNYNFYGFDEQNLDTLHNGEYVFTGTDSTWKNVWICYDYGWLSQYETLDIRFSSISDGIDNQKEGWMIDNMVVMSTMAHTLKTVEQKDYIVAYPNPTKDKLFINVLRSDEPQFIEKLDIINMNGQVIETFKTLPIKFFIDTKNYPAGNYFLRVKTNVKTETLKFSIEK